MKHIALLFMLPLLASCALTKQHDFSRDNSVNNFSMKIAMAPVNQPIMITENTIFGSNYTVIVGELYSSALGRQCRQAKIIEQERIFAVCKDNKSAVENNWIVIPAVQ